MIPSAPIADRVDALGRAAGRVPYLAAKPRLDRRRLIVPCNHTLEADPGPRWSTG